MREGKDKTLKENMRKRIEEGRKGKRRKKRN